MLRTIRQVIVLPVAIGLGHPETACAEVGLPVFAAVPVHLCAGPLSELVAGAVLLPPKGLGALVRVHGERRYALNIAGRIAVSTIEARPEKLTHPLGVAVVDRWGDA